MQSLEAFAFCGKALYFIERYDMGHVYAEVTLKNAVDAVNALDGHIRDEDVRSLTVEVLVDTGATRLCISEETRQKLGLRIVGSKLANIANGTVVKSQLAGPVELTWKDRFFTGDALIVPGLKEPLLGVIPLEAMDLAVNPATQELEYAHGDHWVEYPMSLFEDWGAMVKA
jgi:clan AA aspartic protease